MSQIVLVSGGVGGTPFLSIVKELVMYMKRREAKADSLSIGVSVEEECLESDKDVEANEQGDESTDHGSSRQSLPEEDKQPEHEEPEHPAMQERRADAPHWLHAGMSMESAAEPTSKSMPKRVGSEGPSISFSESGQSSVFSFVDGEKDGDLAFVSTFQRLHFGLSSTTVAFALLWTAIGRFFMALLAIAIFHGLKLGDYVGLKVLPWGFQVADMILSFFVSSVTTALIILDLVYRSEDFPTFYKVIDIGIVIPVLLIPFVGHVLYFTKSIADPGALYPILFYYVLWPATFGVVMFRHLRNGSGMTMLSSSLRNTLRNARSLDFIYTTPTRESDDWLVEELEQYRKSPFFRLHRFLTREKPDLENADDRDNYGRPDWIQLIEALVRNVKSESSIGIFFCGPPAMEEEVRKACYLAMVRSRKRGMYYVQGTAVGFGKARRSKRGSNVRLVLRTENF
jgi:Ferric reductase NAD binding domain